MIFEKRLSEAEARAARVFIPGVERLDLSRLNVEELRTLRELALKASPQAGQAPPAPFDYEKYQAAFEAYVHQLHTGERNVSE